MSNTEKTVLLAVGLIASLAFLVPVATEDAKPNEEPKAPLVIVVAEPPETEPVEDEISPDDLPEITPPDAPATEPTQQDCADDVESGSTMIRRGLFRGRLFRGRFGR